jgi:hypothetical protein
MQHRSVPKQIEHWARLGKAAEENPDMPISMIQDVFISLEEAKAELVLASSKWPNQAH